MLSERFAREIERRSKIEKERYEYEGFNEWL